MSQGSFFRFGLVVSSSVYKQRAARSQLDVGMLAVTLDFHLRIYFIGNAVLQLTQAADPRDAMLPAGYRGWGGIPDLAENAGFECFAEPGWLDRLRDRKTELSIWPEAMSALEMRRDFSNCDRVLML